MSQDPGEALGIQQEAKQTGILLIVSAQSLFHSISITILEDEQKCYFDSQVAKGVRLREVK